WGGGGEGSLHEGEGRRGRLAGGGGRGWGGGAGVRKLPAGGRRSDTAALRIQGMSPAALKAEIEKRYKNRTYQVPERAGLSYMVAPVMRTWMLPDWQVHTMPMPHLMFYAPNLTNEDIGATPDSGLLYPFVFKEGIAEQSYMIQLIGEVEKARIMADERALLHELCSYRDVLCLPNMKH